MKENAIQLIKKERAEQIEKHGYDIDFDYSNNSDCQLVVGAIGLLIGHEEVESELTNWNLEAYRKMASKPYKKRLIIAAALLAAEIDRTIKQEQDNENSN